MFVESLEDRRPLATLTVNAIDDNDDGTCNVDHCSLREAIITANAAAGDDTIQFAAGLTGTINLGSVLPTLSSNIDLQGRGPDLLTVARNSGNSFRLFTVASGATVEISSMTMTNGFFVGTNGGAVYNAGTLTIRDSIITGNTAYYGGGIHNHTNATLFVDRTTISNNAGTQFIGGGGAGGGINNYGNATITNSTIFGNTSEYNGGGISTSIGASLTVRNTTVSDNTAGQRTGIGSGGGIAGEGAVIIEHSTIVNNQTKSGGSGGGVAGAANVTNTIVAGNASGQFGSGPDLAGTITSGDGNSSQNISGATSASRTRWYVLSTASGSPSFALFNIEVIAFSSHDIFVFL